MTLDAQGGQGRRLKLQKFAACLRQDPSHSRSILQPAHLPNQTASTLLSEDYARTISGGGINNQLAALNDEKTVGEVALFYDASVQIDAQRRGLIENPLQERGLGLIKNIKIQAQINKAGTINLTERSNASIHK